MPGGARANDEGMALQMIEDLPPEPGAYALVIELAEESTLEVGALGRVRLKPGRYVYAGSAWGPGGIRARVKRHLRVEKRLHWHIDHLTSLAPVTALVVRPGGRECTLLDALRKARPEASPIPGFGSSDCSRCPAHLFHIPPPIAPRLLADTMERA